MLKKLCGGILTVGGILLGIKGLFSFDVLAWICGGAITVAARIGYALFALAAIGFIAACLNEKIKEKND